VSVNSFAIALANAALWTVYLQLTRQIVGGGRLDSWAYTLVQLLAAGVLMMWLGRRAPGSWRDLISPWTMLYALARVVVVGSTAASLVWLAAAQSTLVATSSVVVGALAAWAIERRPPPRRERWAIAGLFVGIVGLVANLTPDTAWRGAMWTILSESVLVATSFMIAAHPSNRSPDLAVRSRFTGEMLLVTSVALIAGWTVAGLAGVTRTPWEGAGDAFGNPELWMWGVLAGLVFRGPGTWISFWTINAAGVQGYLIGLTAIPFLSILAEIALGELGLINAARLSLAEWLAAAAILAAALWLMVVRLQARDAGAP